MKDYYAIVVVLVFIAAALLCALIARSALAALQIEKAINDILVWGPLMRKCGMNLDGSKLKGAGR